MVRILCGDALEQLKTLPDASVHCCVTSPPYYGLRDYGVAGQIGLEETPEAYVAKLVNVFREVRRVLRDDGTLFLNLGDSYFGGSKSPSQRAASCDTSGKAPVNYQVNGCLCGNLCDVCRKAYQIGKSHRHAQLDPTPSPSLCESSHERKVSLSDHLPTSDSSRQADHIEDAIHGFANLQDHEAGQPPAFPLTMNGESFQQHREDFRQLGQPLGCLLCGHSLVGYAQASSDKTACTCGIAKPLDALNHHMSGTFSSYLPYQYSTTTTLKSKDLIGIPWRVAFALQSDGWILRQDIIWHKPNPMPESVKDRCTKAHEYLFLLAKSNRYWFDSDAMKEEGATSPGIKRQNHKYADAYDDGSELHRTKAGLREVYLNGKRNRRSVWSICPRPYKGAHFAVFPPALVEPCIKAGCPVGGTVLDPFGGSGTTGQVAKSLGRDAILIELNPNYIPLIEKRLA